jgi:hypothetical protein
MNHASETIPGYAYGAEAVAKSWISLQELEQLQISVGFNAEDERYLRLAGEVLGGQTKQIVEHWRSGIIAGIPHLARHSQRHTNKANFHRYILLGTRRLLFTKVSTRAAIPAVLLSRLP